MTIKSNKFILVLTLIILLCAISCIGINSSDKSALAGSDNVVTVDANSVTYNGYSYITAEGKLSNFSIEADTFGNSLYSALEFKLNSSVIVVSPQDITITNLSEIKNPYTYSADIEFAYNSSNYELEDIEIVINKAILNVLVLLDGVYDKTVKEGESYSPVITYSGFLGADNANNALTYPATIPNEPKKPTNEYEIRADGASSDYYEMNYVSSYITITSNPLYEITYTADGEDLLIIRGTYSPYCVLEFVNVGISEASVIYTEMNNEMKKYYSSTGLFDNYIPIASYRINLSIDGINEELESSEISIKIDESLEGYDSYFVLALTNDGVYQVVNATSADGYLSFYTTDLGDFVILAPIQGINTTNFLIIAFCIFGSIALAIILYSVFRRKY